MFRDLPGQRATFLRCGVRSKVVACRDGGRHHEVRCEDDGNELPQEYHLRVMVEGQTKNASKLWALMVGWGGVEPPCLQEIKNEVEVMELPI